MRFMLDIRLLRENPDLVRKNIERRQDPDKVRLLDKVIEYDKVWRGLTTKSNGLRREKNRVSNSVSMLLREGKEASQQMAEG